MSKDKEVHIEVTVQSKDLAAFLAWLERWNSHADGAVEHIEYEIKEG